MKSGNVIHIVLTQIVLPSALTAGGMFSSVVCESLLPSNKLVLGAVIINLSKAAIVN